MREVMNIKELSKYLKCSTSFIRKLQREKKIPYFRVANKILFDKDKIDHWLSESEVISIK